jgi:hypothetical protein
MNIDPPLFTATFRGDPVRVTHATAEEIESLAGPIGNPSDLLELWSLVAIHFDQLIEIHALGWRVLLANTWITSPLVGVNLTLDTVLTRSRKIYMLGSRDKPELDPNLRSHLADALKTWGFDDVRSS